MANSRPAISSSAISLPKNVPFSKQYLVNTVNTIYMIKLFDLQTSCDILSIFKIRQIAGSFFCYQETSLINFKELWVFKAGGSLALWTSHNSSDYTGLYTFQNR